jgi:hypothetical protein
VDRISEQIFPSNLICDAQTSFSVVSAKEKTNLIRKKMNIDPTTSTVTEKREHLESQTLLFNESHTLIAPSPRWSCAGRAAARVQG